MVVWRWFTLVGSKKSSIKQTQEILYWLVVSTHLKNISQTGSFPQVVVKTQPQSFVFFLYVEMDVSKNSGTPNHPF